MTKPNLSVTAGDGSRVYRHPGTGEQVPSVTTVIKGGIPKPLLVPWAARMAAEHACANWARLSQLPTAQRIAEIKSAHDIYRERTSIVGDTVHNLIDCWSTNQPYPQFTKEVDQYANRFIDFMLDKRPEFIENEVTLWSEKHGYAGTADFIAKIDGRTVLGDVKTGRNVYPEVGLQLSALANTDFILREDGREDPLPEFDGLVALHVRPRSWNLIVVSQADECFKAFLAAKQIMEWERNIAPKVLEK